MTWTCYCCGNLGGEHWKDIGLALPLLLLTAVMISSLAQPPLPQTNSKSNWWWWWWCSLQGSAISHKSILKMQNNNTQVTQIPRFFRNFWTSKQVHAKCSGRKKKKPGKNGYRNEHKKERGTRRRRRRRILTTTTTTARALGHQGGRRKKQFGGGRRTGGGREVCGELATALRGEVGYKQGFWQQGDLITI